MQLANVLLALGGERDNTVPKYEVTPAELLLLRALHGDDAVTEIRVLDRDKKIRSAEERERLFAFYARSTPNGRACPQLDTLFPGVGARLPEAFDELGLDDAFYAREVRTPVEKTAARRKKAGKAETAEGEDEAETDASEDGAEDKNLFK